MKKYYEVKYNDYGYGEIFNNYNLSYNGFKIKLKQNGYIGKGLTLEKNRLFSNGTANLIYLTSILEYDTDTKRYFDIITGEEYVELVEKDLKIYLANKGGKLEVYFDKYGYDLSASAVASTLKEFTPLKIEAYTIGVDNLKKAAAERSKIVDDERKRDESYIESFKRNRRK